MKLTPKQERFCAAYMANGGNATEAYKASYAYRTKLEKTIWEAASRVLSNCKVSARLEELRSAAATLAVITEAQVLSEAARIGLSDPAALFDIDGNLIPIHKLPRDVRAAIGSVEVEERQTEIDGEAVISCRLKKVKLWDKNSALEKLFKHMGMFERDNRQRAGIFDHVPREVMKMIEERLRVLHRPDVAGPAPADSSSRFTH